MHTVPALHSTADGEAEEDGNNHVVVPPTPLLPCHIAGGSVDAGVHRFTVRPTSCLLRPPAVGNFTAASRQEANAAPSRQDGTTAVYQTCTEAGPVSVSVKFNRFSPLEL